MEGKIVLTYAFITSNPDGYIIEVVKRASAENMSFVLVLNTNSKIVPLKKRLKKVTKIGILGAILGVYFRRFYKTSFGTLSNFLKENPVQIIEINNFIPDNEQKQILEGIDLGISIGNGYIPRRFFNLFRYGMLNIHHEILPDFPGAQSIVWPLIEKKQNTGYTIHKINEYIDKGEIIAMASRRIVFYGNLMETVEKNYRQSLLDSVDGLMEVLKMHPERWDFYPNDSHKNYTTPTFYQWVKAFYHHYLLKKRENSVINS